MGTTSRQVDGMGASAESTLSSWEKASLRPNSVVSMLSSPEKRNMGTTSHQVEGMVSSAESTLPSPHQTSRPKTSSLSMLSSLPMTSFVSISSSPPRTTVVSILSSPTKNHMDIDRPVGDPFLTNAAAEKKTSVESTDASFSKKTASARRRLHNKRYRYFCRANVVFAASAFDHVIFLRRNRSICTPVLPITTPCRLLSRRCCLLL